jgi:hypothetical protein
LKRQSIVTTYQNLATIELAATHNNNLWSNEESTAITSGRDKVDNENFVYFLRFDPPNNTNSAAGEKNKVSMCYIGYEY